VKYCDCYGGADDTAMEVEHQLPKCSSLLLSRFLFTCGHVALQELIHLDVAVFGELKRRRAVCEANKQSKTGAGKGSTSARASNVSVAASATKTLKVSSALYSVRVDLCTDLTNCLVKNWSTSFLNVSTCK